MKLINYLARNLKDEAVIELLEHYDMEVFYVFDRLQENTADAYSSSAKDAGFELRFNEHQILETIWCYVKPRHGFAAIDSGIVGVPFYGTFTEAVSAAEVDGFNYSESPTNSESWIRLEEEHLWRHYEFTNGNLSLVTLMLPWD